MELQYEHIPARVAKHISVSSEVFNALPRAKRESLYIFAYLAADRKKNLARIRAGIARAKQEHARIQECTGVQAWRRICRDGKKFTI